MDNLIQNFIDMCEREGVPDDRLIKIRTVEGMDTSLDATMTFGEFKENFNRHKIY